MGSSTWMALIDRQIFDPVRVICCVSSIVFVFIQRLTSKRKCNISCTCVRYFPCLSSQVDPGGKHKPPKWNCTVSHETRQLKKIFLKLRD